MNPMPRQLKFSLLFLLCLYGVYAALMVWDSSFVIAGKRWFCLLDDPMISMRYARNLASGLGLVWNAGERVEGITNPGWTAIMALVHLVETDRAHTSLYIQLFAALCNLVTISVTARLAWRLSRGSALVTMVAAAVSAFFFPANYWSLLGMETSLLTTLITAAVFLILKDDDDQTFPWVAYLLLGLATLVRIDAAVPLVIIAVYSMIQSPGKERWKHVTWLAGMLLIFVGGQTLARLWYYGFPFPNTYYLKMSGFPVIQRMARGAVVTFESLGCIFWFVALLLTISLAFRIFKNLQFPKVKLTPRQMLASPWLLPILIFGGQIAYSIYVGGDAWEYGVYCNRFLIVAFPLCAMVWAQLLGYSVMYFADHFKGLLRAGVTIITMAIAILALNCRSCSDEFKEQMYLLNSNTFDARNNEISLKAFLVLDQTPPETVIASDWAGAIPYFLDRYVADPLGKCDVRIAHMNVPRSHWTSPHWESAFYPGHMKWDLEWTFSKYRPDYLFLRFGPFMTKSRESLLKHYSGEVIIEGFPPFWIRNEILDNPSSTRPTGVPYVGQPW